MTRSILITGAGRGLGLEFVRQYLAAGDAVYAFAREPGKSTGLVQLAGEFKNQLSTLPCDVTDAQAVGAAVRRLTELTDALDIVVQNAGVAGQTGATFGDLDFADVRRVFEVNAVAPLVVSELLLPLLRRGRGARLVFVTSRMGSIADNESGGWWAYRMSKAALNMACKNVAHVLAGSGVSTMVIHPGWVRTDMGGGGAPLSPEESVTGMRRVIDALTPAVSGTFKDYTGADLPW